jgi:hypothetical protein
VIEHMLKTWPGPFQMVLDGRKLHEVRKADRPFEAGDLVVLQEWVPEAQGYTGREIRAAITYLTRAGEWGLPPDVCVFSIRVITHNVQAYTLPEPIRVPR